MTNLWNRLAARRRHDVQQSVRDAANGSGAAQQAFYGRQ
jgi:hypothetical protein